MRENEQTPAAATALAPSTNRTGTIANNYEQYYTCVHVVLHVCIAYSAILLGH